MSFRVLGVKKNSVRVLTGIITFDILVIEVNGRNRIKIPDNIFIADSKDFNNLTGVVLSAYDNNVIKDNNVYEENKNIRATS